MAVISKAIDFLSKPEVMTGVGVVFMVLKAISNQKASESANILMKLVAKGQAALDMVAGAIGLLRRGLDAIMGILESLVKSDGMLGKK